MSSNLFKNVDYNSDPLWIAKEVFNAMNNMFFLKTLNKLVDGIGWPNEYAGCQFSNDLDESEEYFEGVLCWYLDYEIIISEKDFYDCLKVACEHYLELNPEKKEEIQKILDDLTNP
jgi:hypothetical protein